MFNSWWNFVSKLFNYKRFVLVVDALLSQSFCSPPNFTIYCFVRCFISSLFTVSSCGNYSWIYNVSNSAILSSLLAVAALHPWETIASLSVMEVSVAISAAVTTFRHSCTLRVSTRQWLVCSNICLTTSVLYTNNLRFRFVPVLHCWHCPHSMRSGVYARAGSLSVCLKEKLKCI